jgi:hypothetical protein
MAAALALGTAGAAVAGPLSSPVGSHWDTDGAHNYLHCQWQGDTFGASRTHVFAGGDGVEVCTSELVEVAGGPQAIAWVASDGSAAAAGSVGPYVAEASLQDGQPALVVYEATSPGGWTEIRLFG